jgi:hypothetical protein
MSTLTRSNSTAIVILAAIGLAGCTSSSTEPEKLKTVKVTGIVKYKGSPVANASVIFQSLDGTISSRGMTDSAGVFTLSTYGNQDGAPPGRYKVLVAASGAKEIEPGVLEDEPPGGFKSPVPTKYANSATTDIVLEILQDGKNDFNIDLK